MIYFQIVLVIFGVTGYLKLGSIITGFRKSNLSLYVDQDIIAIINVLVWPLWIFWYCILKLYLLPEYLYLYWRYERRKSIDKN